MKALKDKVAIISGAGTGIGRAAAKLMAAEGARVVVVGRRVEPLNSVVAEIKADGGEAAACPADLMDGDVIPGIVDFALKTYGRIDVLVNNAGFSSRIRSVRYVQPNEWEEIFKINVEAVYRLTQACLPDMISRREGTIITISSMAALKPGILGGSPYSAAKAASQNFSHGLNSELRSLGIRATVILPGEVDTDILKGRPAPPDADACRLMMQPEDVARCMLLAATLPQRTVIEELVISPTIPRDMSAEMAVALQKGAPE